MDLDYRALSNAGLWFLGRLQTDADRTRVLDGLAAARGSDGMSQELESTLRRLAPRWFVVRNAHVTSPPILMQPRCAISLLRGPMTRLEIRAARGVKDVMAVPAAVPVPEPVQTAVLRSGLAQGNSSIGPAVGVSVGLNDVAHA